MIMNRLFLRHLKNQSGVAALETAFIMPFLLFLYFGLVDLTAMISLNRKRNGLSSQMVGWTSLSTTGSSVSCSRRAKVATASRDPRRAPTGNRPARVRVAGCESVDDMAL
mgnify:CR=1 FL=1